MSHNIFDFLIFHLIFTIFKGNVRNRMLQAYATLVRGLTRLKKLARYVAL